jgi:predicted PurR-regulated permease PerM
MIRQGDAPLSVAAQILLLLGAGALLWALSDVVLLVFAAVLLAVLLRGTAELICRVTGLPVTLCLALVAGLAFLFAFAFGWLFGPRFVAEEQQLVTEILGYTRHIQERYANSFWIQALRRATSGQGSLALGPLAPKLLTVTFGTVGGLFLLIITALYLAVSPRLYLDGLVLLAPTGQRSRTREILHLLGQALRNWMLGQLIDMAVVGVLATLGLGCSESLCRSPLGYSRGSSLSCRILARSWPAFPPSSLRPL